MADWKTYMKAARNTAQRQAPALKDAIVRESETYSRAAQKAWDAKGKDSYRAGEETLSETRKTMHAAAKVAGKRYRQARMTSRLLAAFRDTSIIALSLGAIWFVFSRIIPIPITWVLFIFIVIVLLRILYALTHNPYVETDADDPEGIPFERVPDGAEVKRR